MKEENKSKEQATRNQTDSSTNATNRSLARHLNVSMYSKLPVLVSLLAATLSNAHNIFA